ncbi:MAG: quinol:cytochrome C oxidoreductase [Chitinophaga sp.]
MKDQFVIPARLKTTSFVLLGIGLLTLLIGLFVFSDEHGSTRWWAGILQNSTFFLLVALASTFFIAVTTLAQGGWQMAFRRVPEAISMIVPALCIILLVVLSFLVFGNKGHVYHWVHPEGDHILEEKSPFLNSGFFSIATLITMGLWCLLTIKLRRMSLAEDKMPKVSGEVGKSILWKGTVISGIFIVVYTLSVGSTTPWLWLMSIDAHWYSTMYSWYTFASTWVSGLALITLFVIYLKSQGYLPMVNDEHLHDLGKFMFAFSIFWGYLWFAQYMLIWYANIPEETVYFQPRVWGEFRSVFFLNLIINFVAPLLIFMKRSSKRNYTLVAFMSGLIVFGHWLDFFQMVAPGTVKHLYFPWYELGVGLGFLGLTIYLTALQLAKAPLTAKNHPYLKESIIHHT